MRASELVEHNSIVRVTGYEPIPGVPDQAFVAAWREAAQYQPAGLIYRELCRQVPEWNELIKAEIQNLNPFAFIDYAVLTPEEDPNGLQALPESIASQYRTVAGTYTIVSRFAHTHLTSEPNTIFYNLFEISGPPHVEQGFVLNWPVRAEFQSRQAGFFSAMLHRRSAPSEQITAFNRAEWQDAEAYAHTIAAFDAQFPVAGRVGGPTPSPTGQTGSGPVRSFLGLYRILEKLENKQETGAQQMKAVQFEAYGGPEVLIYSDVPIPVPGPGQVLLKIHAVGVNHLDAKIRSGSLKTVHPAWFPDILGFDLSGIIESVGRSVDTARIGEAVYGTITPFVRRGYAEYAVASANLMLPKPHNLDFIQAAAVPSVALTAYNALFSMGNLQAGQTVLIHGGAGSVGTYAIQFAKQIGAQVITTASSANTEYVRRLGADIVIDYRTQRFEEHISNVDMVLDAIGGDTRSRSWGTLKRGGTLVTLVPPLPDSKVATEYGVRGMMNQNPANPGGILTRITNMLESGTLQMPSIGLTLSLAEAPQAHELLENNRVQGRIVLQVR